MRSGILLIAGNDDTAGETVKSLTENGFEKITVAATIAEAIDSVKESPPWAVLIHCPCPWQGLSGLIPEHDLSTPGFPVVFIADEINPDLLSAAREYPYYGLVLRPLRGDELAAAIDTAVYRYKQEAVRGAQVDKSMQGITIVQDGRIVYVNHRIEILGGYRAEKLYALRSDELFRLVHHDDRDKIIPALQRGATPDGGVSTIEFRVLRGDNRYRWLKCSMGGWMHGNKPAVMMSVIDITDRVEAEKNLKESEKNYRTVVERANDLIVIVQDETILYVNQKASILGYEPVEMIGNNFAHYIHRSSQKLVVNFYNLRMQNLYAPSIYEALLVHKNGSAVPMEISGGTTQYGGKNADLAILRDISERRRLEESLRESEKRFRELASMLPQAVYETDEKLNFTFVNRAGIIMYGYTEEDDIRNVNILDTVAPEDLDRVKASLMDRITGQEKGLVELTAIRKDGSTFPVLSAPAPIMKNGILIGVRGIIIDNTERKADEEKIRRTIHEKETLLIEVHHRVKNNLQLIASMLNLQSEKTISGEAVQALRESHTRVLAMAKIHETLYHSESFSEIDFKVYLNSIISDLSLMIMGNTPGVAIDIRAEPVTLGLNQAIPLGLIVNELFTNALKYAFPGGRTGPQCAVTVSLSENRGAVTLTVADNGIGLPGDIDPDNAGTLGLTLVSILVKQIKGVMRVRSDTGTRFDITFKR